MSLFADRVKETTTTTGTGTINLAGAATGFQTFVAAVGNGNPCYYAIVHQSAAEWEVGKGTITDASPDTLSRTTILASSNSGSAVSFSAGTKDVFVTIPAYITHGIPINVIGYNASGSATTTTTTGTNTSGATTITITSSATFVANQGVLIAGAGAAGVDYIGTVTSVPNSTSIVVSPSISTTVSAGTLVQHDDTVAIQAAIDAVNNATAKGGTVFFPDGIYRVNKALDSGDGNGILKIISTGAGGAAKGCIVALKGATGQFVADFTTSGNSGAIITADRRAGSGTVPSILCAKDSGTSVYLENLTFRTPTVPTLTPLNLYDALNAWCVNVVVDTDTGSDVTPEPVNATTAFRMPQTQNFGMSYLENCLAEGHKIGISFSENTVFNHAVVYSCALGLEAQEGVVTATGNVLIYRCAQLLKSAATSNAFVNITMSVQNIAAAGNWYSRGGVAGTLKDIDDASNFIKGLITYSYPGSSGLTYNGASQIGVFDQDSNTFQHRALTTWTEIIYPAVNARDVLRINNTTGNANFQLGSLAGDTSYAMFYMGNIAAGDSNYVLQSNGVSTVLNGNPQIDFRSGNDFNNSMIWTTDKRLGVNVAYNASISDTLHVAGTAKITGGIKQREATVASSAAPTPNADTTDIYTVTALATGATFGAPTGTPIQGQKLLIRIKDSGGAQSLAWNAIYRAIGITLPTTTVTSKTLYVGCIYNFTDTKWDVLSTAQEA